MKPLTKEEVYESLCYYDKRSSGELYGYDDDVTPPRKKDCMCDNCFYKRDRLAMEIIRIQEWE